MATRIAINGCGRIGRAFLKKALEHSELEVVAVNDLAPVENIAYLIKYDSTYGRSGLSVEVNEGDTPELKIGKNNIKYLSVREPSELPWGDLDVDIVVESTGLFATYEKSKAHLDAGAKRVVISAPVKGDPVEGVTGATVLMGVNEELLKTCNISSNASCTTNAGSPLISILNESIGVEKAVLTTVHGYTASQGLVDGPHKKNVRLGRAAGVNIVPTSTGAAIATTKAIPELEGKFDGIALRVPVIAGSMVDVTFISKKGTTVEEVNKALSDAALSDRWSGIFATTTEELVSTDILGEPYASIADLNLTRVIDGNLVKVCAWYDNEGGYTHALVAHVLSVSNHV